MKCLPSWQPKQSLDAPNPILDHTTPGAVFKTDTAPEQTADEAVDGEAFDSACRDALTPLVLADASSVYVFEVKALQSLFTEVGTLNSQVLWLVSLSVSAQNVITDVIVRFLCGWSAVRCRDISACMCVCYVLWRWRTSVAR